MQQQIDTMQADDWAQVRTIYAEGLSTGIAAFAQNPPRWTEWDAGHLSIGRLVARASAGQVLGWAALSAVPDT